MSQENGLSQGRVKWFSVEKEYGFIVQDGGDDVYLNAREVPKGTTLVEGDEVEFTVETRERDGKTLYRARNVKLVQQAAS